MSGRRSASLEPAAVLRSAIPLAIVVAAAALPVLAPVVLAVLVGGVAVAAGRGAPVRWAWAAPIPVAAALSWNLVAASAAGPGGRDCTALTSPPAAWGLAGAVLVLAIVAALATALRSPMRDLALRRPSKDVVQLAVIGGALLAPVGVLAAGLLAGPLTGSFSVDIGDLRFLAPALIYAIAGGVMEEVAYRGALLHWAGRVIGIWPALVVQAVVYGLAHGGTDATGTPVILITILGAGGFVAGLVAIRTRSLLVPIVWHVALNVGLYAWLACRT